MSNFFALRNAYASPLTLQCAITYTIHPATSHSSITLSINTSGPDPMGAIHANDVIQRTPVQITFLRPA